MILLFFNLILGKGLTILVYAEEEQEKEKRGIYLRRLEDFSLMFGYSSMGGVLITLPG